MQFDVIDVDRMEGSIIVTFGDGLVVRYSADLLRQIIGQAEILPATEDAEPEDSF